MSVLNRSRELDESTMSAGSCRQTMPRRHRRTMDNFEQALHRLGGIAHITQLRDLGISGDSLERAARVGAVARVRQGIYALPSAPLDVVRAARVGGRLAGSSATRALGLWMPPGQPLTVEVSRARSRLLHPDIPGRSLDVTANVRVLWTRESRAQSHAFGVVSIEDCLVQCIRTLRPSWAVAVLDSALRHTPLSEFDLADLATRLPRRLHWLIGLVDARAESGTESVVRVALRQIGVFAAIQVPIPFSPLERFDLVVGDRLVIECDSAEYHGSAADRELDLRRDALAAGYGFVVLRFGYPQIMFDWMAYSRSSCATSTSGCTCPSRRVRFRADIGRETRARAADAPSAPKDVRTEPLGPDDPAHARGIAPPPARPPPRTPHTPADSLCPVSTLPNPFGQVLVALVTPFSSDYEVKLNFRRKKKAAG